MSLVHELQVSASQDGVLTVLRKVKIVASKLGRREIEDWLEAERTGYWGTPDVPDYRKVHATPAYNTNGPIPAGLGLTMNGIADLPYLGLDGPLPLREPIGEIMEMIRRLQAGEKMLVLPVNEGTELCELYQRNYRFDPPWLNQRISFLLRLSPSQVLAIPERIKDRVLDWACNLEAAGVIGEGMSFNVEERQRSANVTFNLTNCRVGQLSNTGMNWRG